VLKCIGIISFLSILFLLLACGFEIFNPFQETSYIGEISPTPTPTPTPTKTNVALNKPVIVSTEKVGYPASNAVDGNNTTQWWTNDYADTNNPQVLEVDLNGEYMIEQVKILWDTGSDYGVDYEIKTKTTGSYSTQVTVTDATGGQQDYNFSSVVAFYVQLYITNTNFDCSQLFEFEVYGWDTGNPTPTPTVTPNNLAFNKTAIASTTHEIYIASNAVDGNYLTKWWSNEAGTVGTPQTIEVDLGAEYTIDTVKIYWNEYLDFGVDYEIKTKTTGAFETQATITGATGGFQEHNFTAVNAQHVQVYITNSDFDWLQVFEFEVYE